MLKETCKDDYQIRKTMHSGSPRFGLEFLFLFWDTEFAYRDIFTYFKLGW